MIPQYEVTRLPNGARLVTVPMPHVRSATVVVSLGVGSRFEESHEAGSSHLIEHMLFKGTPRRPTAQSISEVIETVGGSLNASTDKETTSYWARVAAGDLPLAVDLLSDMLLHSLFAETEVRKEKRVVVEELGMALDSPQDWVHTLIEEIVWSGQSLGRDVAGTRESVSHLTRDGLVTYMRAQYVPQAAVITVAGRLDAPQVQERLAAQLDRWTGDHDPPSVAPAAYGAGTRRVLLQTRETEQANLCIAVQGLGRHDDRRYAMDLLNSILGGSMTSRLFVRVREEQGLVYDIHSYSESYADAGLLVVYAGTEPSHASIVTQEIVAALRRFRVEPVGDEELEKVKRGYRGRLVLGLEDSGSVASWCGGQELLHGVIESPEDVLRRIEEVTPEAIQSLAADLFHDTNLRLAAIGPFSDERMFEDLLHF